MRLGRTTLFHFASHVVVSLAGFAATFAIARLGGADLIGLYAPAVAVAFWLNIPATAVGDSLTKRLSEGSDRGEYLATGLVMLAGIAVVLGVAVVLGTPLVNWLVGAEVGDVVALLVVGNVAFIGVRAVLNGEKKVARAAGTKSLERIVRSVLQIAAVAAGYGVTALVAGHAAALFVGTLAAVVFVDLSPGRPTRRAARSLFDFARYTWLSTLKTRAFSWMDTVVLAAFAVGSTLIGVYEVAWSLASVFALVAVSVKSTLFPEMSELGVDDEHDRIHHYLNEGLVFTGVFVIPGLFGAWALGERVLRIYRPEFTQGAPILVLLVLARMLAAYGEQFLNVVNAIDRPDVAFRVNLAFAGSNLLLNVALIYLYGWVGAAVATVLSAGVGLVYSYVALSRLVGRPDVPVLEIARQAVAALVMVAAVVSVRPAVPTGNYLTIGLVLAGAAVYTAVLIAVSGRIRAKVRGLAGV
ncbi:lipid II flippase MurJ [Halosimplex halophilum]|uniref:lipid II flippase MurJ n=1 Tax=Halosimplex halophilum TaxID=2559572 RepID=UPI00107F8681|nr:polysaccharide biosynthesis C-terminal domain-containing protein [Halosimplex halophilum]